MELDLQCTTSIPDYILYNQLMAKKKEKTKAFLFELAGLGTLISFLTRQVWAMMKAS